ncbi:MAG: threonylcarbamoyl-AMP synthase [Magnetovibrio sp.]|nr:threonylcarbamoyl-AMP synthase [Magnetovibrio sp.]
MKQTTFLSDSDNNLNVCARALSNGELVAFPTETVYGLGAIANCDSAVAAIFEAKKRPSFNPLIVHVSSISDAKKIVQFNERAEELAASFWPGALTMVLPRLNDCGISLLVSAGLDSIAIRVPTHPLAQKLLAKTAHPIAAPSANRSGEISPTTAAHVVRSFSQISMQHNIIILDGGACEVGLESSVVDLTGEQSVLLRPGGVTSESIEAVIGELKFAASENCAPKSPGMLSRHYAPKTPLRLNAHSINEGELLLGFGPTQQKVTFNLSESGNLVQAAANLFAMLHDLDLKTPSGIAVMPIPLEGLGLAINDRLKRAISPKTEN